MSGPSAIELPAASPIVRVEFGRLECARSVLFRLLDVEALSPRLRSALASRGAAALRDAGLLGAALEEHYSATEAARRVSRCADHIVDEIHAGRLRPAFRDGRGYLVPASALHAWLAERVFDSSSLTEKQAAG